MAFTHKKLTNREKTTIVKLIKSHGSWHRHFLRSNINTISSRSECIEYFWVSWLSKNVRTTYIRSLSLLNPSAKLDTPCCNDLCIQIDANIMCKISENKVSLSLWRSCNCVYILQFDFIPVGLCVYVLMVFWINCDDTPSSTSCMVFSFFFSCSFFLWQKKMNWLYYMHDDRMTQNSTSEWSKHTHACMHAEAKWIPKIYPLYLTQPHILIHTTKYTDLNLKFRARFNGNDALYVVEAVMSTCCTCFFHFCLLFFINYAILRLNMYWMHM